MSPRTSGPRLPWQGGEMGATAARAPEQSSGRITKNKEESVGQVEKLGVVGAGTMGHGIAQVAAQAGFDVTGATP